MHLVCQECGTLKRRSLYGEVKKEEDNPFQKFEAFILVVVLAVV